MNILQQREAMLRRLMDPLPGHEPRDRFKLIRIPPQCHGLTLAEAAARVVRHLSSADWAHRCAEGWVVDDEGRAVEADHRVRPGEIYWRKYPAMVEPDISTDVRFLHEDAALVVVNKPAPMPMHEGGRFYRNTLQHALEMVYRPQKPQAAHRLDANTTGVVIIAREPRFAGPLQVQFERRQVTKNYLVRVQGHPPEDEFICQAPISRSSGHSGSRFIDETDSGLPSHTEFTVLRRDPDATAVLEARPLTGRTNQIRVHLWHLGLPVLGDPTYLPAGALGQRQTLKPQEPPLCLHAWTVDCRHPVTRERMIFTAPPPAWAGLIT